MTRLEKMKKLAEEMSELVDKIKHIDEKSVYVWTEEENRILREINKKSVEFVNEWRLLVDEKINLNK